MKETRKQRPFFMTSIEDAMWLEGQHDSVKTLWSEASRADPFGTDGWQPLTTRLKDRSFRSAKKTIVEYGAFEFQVKPDSLDARKTLTWEVRNKRGSRIEGFWKIDGNELPPIGNELPPIGNELPPIGNELPPIGNELPPIECETFAASGVHILPDFNQTLSEIKQRKTDLCHESSEFPRSGRSESAPLEATHSSLPDALNPDSGASLRNENPEQSETFCDSKESRSGIEAENVGDRGVGRVSPPPQNSKIVAKTDEKVKAKQRHPQTLRELLGALQPSHSQQIQEFASWMENRSLSPEFLLAMRKDINNTDALVLRDAINAVKENLSRGKKIDNLGGYFRQALSHSWKPREGTATPAPAEVSRQPLTVDTWTPELGLDEMSLRLWKEVPIVDEDLRVPCIREMIRLQGQPFMQHNVFRQFYVQQSNRDYAKRKESENHP